MPSQYFLHIRMVDDCYDKLLNNSERGFRDRQKQRREIVELINGMAEQAETRTIDEIECLASFHFFM